MRIRLPTAKIRYFRFLEALHRNEESEEEEAFFTLFDIVPRGSRHFRVLLEDIKVMDAMFDSIDELAHLANYGPACEWFHDLVIAQARKDWTWDTYKLADYLGYVGAIFHPHNPTCIGVCNARSMLRSLRAKHLTTIRNPRSLKILQELRQRCCKPCLAKAAYLRWPKAEIETVLETSFDLLEKNNVRLASAHSPLLYGVAAIFSDYVDEEVDEDQIPRKALKVAVHWVTPSCSNINFRLLLRLLQSISSIPSWILLKQIQVNEVRHEIRHVLVELLRRKLRGTYPIERNHREIYDQLRWCIQYDHPGYLALYWFVSILTEGTLSDRKVTDSVYRTFFDLGDDLPYLMVYSYDDMRDKLHDATAHHVWPWELEGQGIDQRAVEGFEQVLRRTQLF